MDRSVFAFGMKGPPVGGPFSGLGKHIALVALVLAVAAPATARAEGDPNHGKELYAQCMACHQIRYNQVGPRHVGLFGRKAGSLPDYSYSPALRNSGIVWSEQTLDRWIENPRALVPGTKMLFGGMPDPQDRADLIAYLKIATQP
jgi:cytochrome c